MSSTSRPTTAVILAAGMGTRLGKRGLTKPKGFLELGDRPLIEQSLDRLRESAIEHVIIVTGHCAEWYDELADASNGFVSTVANDRYSESGSMYSLYRARNSIADDFLLLESDLVYEQRALEEITNCPTRDCILLSGLTRSGDEVYVEAPAGRLIGMSKDPSQLGSVTGELVGISRISFPLFSRMLELAETAFETSLKYDYETDCLVDAARSHAIHCHLVPDLAWAEIDDDRHMRRAIEEVFPAIRERDGLKL